MELSSRDTVEKLLTEDGIRKRIRRLIDTIGSQPAADYLGVSQVFMYDVLERSRSVGKQIPMALGCERLMLYRDLNPAPVEYGEPEPGHSMIAEKSSKAKPRRRGGLHE